MEPWRHGAVDLARMIVAGDVSAREVVDSNLERIESVNGHLNAITVVLADEACAAADRADGPRGPLHGVPFTVKENIDVAGTATTDGLPALARRSPRSTRRSSSACAPPARSPSAARTCPTSACACTPTPRCAGSRGTESALGVQTPIDPVAVPAGR